MERVTRFGVSIEPKLLREFDKLIKRRGYENRSKAVRDLIRRDISTMEVEKETGQVVGTITLIYDHEVGEVTDRLLHAQHHHHEIVASTAHMHLDESNCLEVLMVQGNAKEVRDFANRLIATRGVKLGEIVVSSTAVL
ncbi:MAG: nickel-responsive transcriptional regulator NikR [Thermoplasmata archaeon]